MTCPIYKKECNNLGVGRECLALTSTYFGKKSCPFYKPSKTDYKAKFVFKGREGVWKAIRGYEGKYFVSDFGEVYNYRNRQVKVSYNGDRPFVSLEDNYGFVARHYVAVIVADAFLTGEGRICYRDGNRLNCKATNLYRSISNGNTQD